MDISEIRKKAKRLKDKLVVMEDSIKQDTLDGRKELEKITKSVEPVRPIETTPEAQKQSNFKMADAVELGDTVKDELDETKTEKESVEPSASIEVEDTKPEKVENSMVLTAEEEAEFKALSEMVIEEEKTESLKEDGIAADKTNDSPNSQSERLLDNLITESVKAEIDLDKQDKMEKTSLRETKKESSVDDKALDGLAFDATAQVAEEKNSSKQDLLTEDDIEWGTEEDLEEIEDFEIEALIFSLGKENYGMDIQLLSEVIVATELIEIPRAPDGTEGLLSLRGEMIPVMNLKSRIGLDDSESQNTRILILKDEESLIGLYVDSVDDVIGFLADDLEGAPKVSSIDSSLIESLGRKNGKPFILLNMMKILEKI